MNNLDLLIQQEFAISAAPKFEGFEPLATSGQRYVLGRQGLKLEIKRPWLHAVVSMHEGPARLPLPYGEAPADGVTLLCGFVPRALAERFLVQARLALPNETAAWITWDEKTREFAYVPLAAQSASPGHVTYEVPSLPQRTHLVLDLHSHGAHAAFFSSQDDVDDYGTVKLAAVLGNVDQDEPTMAARACLLGTTCAVERLVLA